MALAQELEYPQARIKEALNKILEPVPSPTRNGSRTASFNSPLVNIIEDWLSRFPRDWSLRGMVTNVSARITVASDEAWDERPFWFWQKNINHHPARNRVVINLGYESWGDSSGQGYYVLSMPDNEVPILRITELTSSFWTGTRQTKPQIFTVTPLDLKVYDAILEAQLKNRAALNLIDSKA